MIHYFGGLVMYQKSYTSLSNAKHIDLPKLI